AASHRRELGGTRILWEALRAGQIDVYPEYTGTLSQELLPGETDLPAALARLGVRMGPPIGFEDNYAIGMRRDVARRFGVRATSDLSAHPEVRLGFRNELMLRRDGWPRPRPRGARRGRVPRSAACRGGRVLAPHRAAHEGTPRAGRDLARRGDPALDPAGNSRLPASAPRTGGARVGRRAADDSVAGAARL